MGQRAVWIVILSSLLTLAVRAEDPAALAPLPAEQWDARKAAHLLGRAGFGGLPTEILKLAAMTPEQAVALLVDYDKLEGGKQLVFPPFDPSDQRHKRAMARYHQRLMRSMTQQRLRRFKLELADALKQGMPSPISTKDLLKTAKAVKPSTAQWFASAKNYALYANEGGHYNEILDYLNMR